MISLAHILVLLNIVMCSYSYNVILIKDYLTSNNLTTLLWISCGQHEINPSQIITLQRHGIWINFWDISSESTIYDFDYDKFFVRLSHPHCVVVDLECNQTTALMTQLSKQILFHNERNWLMFSSSLERSHDILKRQNINVDAEIILAVPEPSDNYNLYEVFNPSMKRGGQLNITQLGYWNSKFGFDVPLKQTKIERRRDLKGITIPSVIALTNVPNHTTFLEHLNSNDFIHLDSMNRLIYHLFRLMMEMHNFKIFIQLTDIWGSFDSKGWHGAIGMLNRSEADFCLAALRWDNKRYGAYEHTTHAYHVQIQFIFRHPKSVDAVNVFLLPFDGKVWYAIFALCACFAYVVRITFSVERQSNHQEMNENSYSNTVLMVLGFIFQQSYYGNSLLASSRILTISMLVFSLLIYQFYSSFIVGSLLTVAPKNIKTVKQLLNSRFDFGIDTVPYVIDNFHVAKEESTVQLYNQIMKNPEKALMLLPTGIALLKKGGFVFNTDGSYAYILLNQLLTDSEKCELQHINYIPKFPTGPAVTNKSPFKELIKISIRKFTETGLLSYYNKIWYGTRPKCEISDLNVVPVDIVHFSSALYIVLIGIIFSGTIFLCEIFLNFWLKRKLKINHVQYLE